MRSLPELGKPVPVGVVGAGYYLPDRILSNADLEKMVDTSDQWIVERTGIRERRIADPNVSTSDMAVFAAKAALEHAAMQAEEIDMIICATVTPDMLFPSTACLIQKGIDARNAFAFDISAACTGFIYAMATAYTYLASNYVDSVLVVGAEKMSSITDYEDRNTCVLFGDGAGAVVLKRIDKPGHGIIDFILESDGRNAHWLQVPAGGSRMPASTRSIGERMHYISMEGREVFKFAVTAMKRTTVRIAERNNIGADDLTWLIPHQANKRIIDAAAAALGLSQDRIHYNIHKYGNMSAASTAVGLAEVVLHNNLEEGDTLLLVAFGAGMTWGSILIRW
jgi:3-oxoacyl-[acyl-carrier-protein] synthase-3